MLQAGGAAAGAHRRETESPGPDGSFGTPHPSAGPARPRGRGQGSRHAPGPQARGARGGRASGVSAILDGTLTHFDYDWSCRD
eukprot:3336367-Prymnesium_polylepis.2